MEILHELQRPEYREILTPYKTHIITLRHYCDDTVLMLIDDNLAKANGFPTRADYLTAEGMTKELQSKELWCRADDFAIVELTGTPPIETIYGNTQSSIN